MSIPRSTVDETEQERLRRAEELASESGPNWAAAFQPGSEGCHELLDRASMLQDMVDRYLLSHPACVSHPDWYALAERAAAALAGLYQRVGAEHMHEVKTEESTTTTKTANR